MAEALPGSDAVAEAQRLAVGWTGDVESWRDGMQRHAEDMVASELTYAATDAGEWARFSGGWGLNGQYRRRDNAGW